MLYTANQNGFSESNYRYGSWSKLTYESGVYAFIYINGKFQGINKKGEIYERNTFSFKYYTEELVEKYNQKNNKNISVKDLLKNRFYSRYEYFENNEEILEFMNYQTLFGKDYFVILRPELLLNITMVITYDANGGNVNIPKGNQIFNLKYTSLPEPTRNEYIFDGWYTSESGGTKVTETTVVTQTSEHTLYAHWIKLGDVNNDNKITSSDYIKIKKYIMNGISLQ